MICTSFTIELRADSQHLNQGHKWWLFSDEDSHTEVLEFFCPDGLYSIYKLVQIWKPDVWSNLY